MVPAHDHLSARSTAALLGPPGEEGRLQHSFQPPPRNTTSTMPAASCSLPTTQQTPSRRSSTSWQGSEWGIRAQQFHCQFIFDSPSLFYLTFCKFTGLIWRPGMVLFTDSNIHWPFLALMLQWYVECLEREGDYFVIFYFTIQWCSGTHNQNVLGLNPRLGGDKMGLSS